MGGFVPIVELATVRRAVAEGQPFVFVQECLEGFVRLRTEVVETQDGGATPSGRSCGKEGHLEARLHQAKFGEEVEEALFVVCHRFVLSRSQGAHPLRTPHILA